MTKMRGGGARLWLECGASDSQNRSPFPDVVSPTPGDAPREHSQVVFCRPFKVRMFSGSVSTHLLSNSTESNTCN